MLRGVALPPNERLTPHARALAFPEFSEQARDLIRQAAPKAPARLDAAALLAAARERTGLNDFGDAPLQQPLEALCGALNDEMELHALGRFYVYGQILGLLSTRLRLVDLWRRNPDILHQKIERPIIIIGLPRSGTTILHKLLARDPARRVAPFWEQVMPLPTGEPDTRVALAEASLESLHTMAPDFASMHEMSIDEPDEDILQLVYGFASKQFEWSYVVPSFVRWYRGADHTLGYQWFKQVLQTSQWLRPGAARWVLKAPQHLEHLDALMRTFPDAALVQTHRDPATAVISLASMTAYGQRRYFDHPNPHFLGANMADIVERLLRAGEAARPTLSRPVIDIAFSDLVRAPLTCVRRIYDAAGDTLSTDTEARMSKWIAENRQEKHGKHAYAAEDVGLDADALRRRFAFYQHRLSD